MQTSGDEPVQVPLPHRVAWPAVARCVGRTAALLAARRVRQPRAWRGRVLAFADGSSAVVYRETVVDGPPPREPCVLVVRFRLRGVHGRVAHAAFRRESLLNTPLFVGFPGFLSKLWLAHDGHDVYRGVYEWDGPAAAGAYARALWRVLALVSVRGSIGYRVLPGLRRADLFAPAAAGRTDGSEWWRPLGAPGFR